MSINFVVQDEEVKKRRGQPMICLGSSTWETIVVNATD